MQLITVLELITCGVQETGNRACGLRNLDEELACSPCASPAGNTSNLEADLLQLPLPESPPITRENCLPQSPV